MLPVDWVFTLINGEFENIDLAPFWLNNIVGLNCFWGACIGKLSNWVACTMFESPNPLLTGILEEMVLFSFCLS